MSEQQMQPSEQAVVLPDHQTLSRLAQENPLALEALRQQLVEDVINSAPEARRPRLRGLQFRIDAIRRLSHSPLGAAVKISGLMWDSFLEMNQQLQDFDRFVRAGQGSPSAALAESRPPRSAQVIQFRLPQSVKEK